MTSENQTRTTLRDLVQEYYDENGLPEATLQRLRVAPRPRSSTVRQWRIAGALAATLVIAALGLSMLLRGAGSPGGVALDTPLTPNLVAVQIHADWCARSPEVAPVFAELLSQYGNEPVLFVTLDITDDVRREQARLLSSNLGIPQALAEPFESGMIKLIDRRNDAVLAAITGREQAGEMEIRISEALTTIHGEGREGSGGGA